MTEQLMNTKLNQERIHAVESSFGPLGRPLSQPGRVLIGEGRLMKQSRRGPQPKVFFLFNDLLVYGSIILNGHWHKKQQIIPLGEQLMMTLSNKQTEHTQQAQTFFFMFVLKHFGRLNFKSAAHREKLKDRERAKAVC